METNKKTGAKASTKTTKSVAPKTAKAKASEDKKNANDLTQADVAETKKELLTNHEDKNLVGDGEAGKIDQVTTKEVTATNQNDVPADIQGDLKQTHEAPYDGKNSDNSDNSGDINAVQTKVITELPEDEPQLKIDYEKVFRKYIGKHGKKKSKATNLTDLWNESNEGAKNRRSLPVVLAILDEGKYKDFRKEDRKALIAGLKKVKNEGELQRFLYSNYAEEQDIHALNELIRNNG